MLNLRSKILQNFFHLQSALDSEFFRGGVQAPTYFGHSKFEVKNFSELFNLKSTLDSEFFKGSVWAPNFFSHAKFEVKNFLEFF